MALRTDYKNDELNTAVNTERQFEEVTNPNGTKSYRDVTDYSQVGDNFDADLVNSQNAEINAKAPLDSPAFTGTPTAPTQSQSTSDDTIATTAYVKSTFSNIIDPNLRISGKAADAQVTGNRIASVQESIPSIDTTLSINGAAADALATGNRIATEIGELNQKYLRYFNSISSIYGANADINDVIDQGMYLASNGNTFTNNPLGWPDAYHLEVYVYSWGSGSMITQIAINLINGNVAVRYKVSSWLKWKSVGSFSNGFISRKHSAGMSTDLNDVKDTGIWMGQSPNSYTNKPTWALYSFTLIVCADPESGMVCQIYSDNDTGNIGTRYFVNNSWSAWQTQTTNNIRWKGIISGSSSAGTDLDTLTSSGIWISSAGSNYVNKPFNWSDAFLFEVYDYNYGTGHMYIQVATNLITSGVATRYKVGSNNWIAWRLNDPSLMNHGFISRSYSDGTSTDLNDVKTPGLWIGQGTNSYANKPSWVAYSFTLVVAKDDTSGMVCQIITDNETGRVATRYYYSSWTTWKTQTVDLIKWKGQIGGSSSAGTDLNTVTTTGIWISSSGSNFVNKPFSWSDSFILEVYDYNYGSAHMYIQVATNLGTGEVATRYKVGSNDWVTWKSSFGEMRGLISSFYPEGRSTDLNDVTTVGTWLGTTPNSYGHLPAIATGMFTLEVVRDRTLNLIIQTFRDIYTGWVASRYCYNGSWDKWITNKDAFDVVEEYAKYDKHTITADELESGQWSYSTKAANAKRLRNKNLIPVKRGMCIEYTNPTLKVYFGVLASTSATTYLQNSGWISVGASDANYQIYNDGYLVVMCSSDNNITVSDYDCIISLRSNNSIVNGGMMARNGYGTSVDINEVRQQGVYFISSPNTNTNNPFGWTNAYTLEVVEFDIITTQVATNLETGEVATRYCYNGNWGTWKSARMHEDRNCVYYAFGDSTTWGWTPGDHHQSQNAYPFMVGKLLNLTVHNNAVPAQGLIKNWDDINTTIDDATMTDADLITVGWGYNDASFYGSTPLGTASDTTTDTVVGYYYNIMKKLQQKCPTALVMLITTYGDPTAVDGRATCTKQFSANYHFADGYHTVGEFYDTLEEMCHLHGWHCVNQHHGSGINEFNASTVIGDNIHPTDEGYLTYSRPIAAQIASKFANLKSLAT